MLCPDRKRIIQQKSFLHGQSGLLFLSILRYPNICFFPPHHPHFCTSLEPLRHLRWFYIFLLRREVTWRGTRDIFFLHILVIKGKNPFPETFFFDNIFFCVEFFLFWSCPRAIIKAILPLHCKRSYRMDLHSCNFSFCVTNIFQVKIPLSQLLHFF